MKTCSENGVVVRTTEDDFEPDDDLQEKMARMATATKSAPSTQHSQYTLNVSAGTPSGWSALLIFYTKFSEINLVSNSRMFKPVLLLLLMLR